MIENCLLAIARPTATLNQQMQEFDLNADVFRDARKPEAGLFSCLDHLQRPIVQPSCNGAFHQLTEEILAINICK